MYVDTSTSNDTAMWAKGHGPEGCFAAATLFRRTP